MDSQAAIPDELQGNVFGYSPPPSPPQTTMLQVRLLPRPAATHAHSCSLKKSLHLKSRSQRQHETVCKGLAQSFASSLYRPGAGSALMGGALRMVAGADWRGPRHAALAAARGACGDDGERARHRGIAATSLAAVRGLEAAVAAAAAAAPVRLAASTTVRRLQGRPVGTRRSPLRRVVYPRFQPRRLMRWCSLPSW